MICVIIYAAILYLFLEVNSFQIGKLKKTIIFEEPIKFEAYFESSWVLLSILFCYSASIFGKAVTV